MSAEGLRKLAAEFRRSMDHDTVMDWAVDAVSSLKEAADELSRLQSLSDQNRLTGGWRDIESAPKDGSYIVAWGKPCSSADEGPWVTRWQDYGEGSIALERWKSGDGPKGTFWHSEPVNNWTNGWKPTHWQPLPSPPLPLPGGEEKR